MQKEAGVGKKGDYELKKIVSQVKFVEEPPDNIRKSNFFSFMLSFNDRNGNPLIPLSAKFVNFVRTLGRKPKKYGEEIIASPIVADQMEAEDPDVQFENRLPEVKMSNEGFVASKDESQKSSQIWFENGIEYEIIFQTNDGDIFQQPLWVRVIDDKTHELVEYEAQDKDPMFAKVLLTHESICSRCKIGKSCGNKNETPSDPIVVEKYFLRFSMKCNQNCLKNAGRICNPDILRKFSIVILEDKEYVSVDKSLVVSSSLFVHNNSKYGRKNSDRSLLDGTPRILAICPSQGGIEGGKTVVIIGENFFEGIAVIFGNIYGSDAILITSHAISVKIPRQNYAGVTEVSLFHKGKRIPKVNSARFMYLSNSHDLESGYERLSQFTSVQWTHSREAVLHECADIMEIVYRDKSLHERLRSLMEERMYRERSRAGASSGEKQPMAAHAIPAGNPKGSYGKTASHHEIADLYPHKGYFEGHHQPAPPQPQQPPHHHTPRYREALSESAMMAQHHGIPPHSYTPSSPINYGRQGGGSGSGGNEGGGVRRSPYQYHRFKDFYIDSAPFKVPMVPALERERIMKRYGDYDRGHMQREKHASEGFVPLHYASSAPAIDRSISHHSPSSVLADKQRMMGGNFSARGYSASGPSAGISPASVSAEGANVDAGRIIGAKFGKDFEGFEDAFEREGNVQMFSGHSEGGGRDKPMMEAHLGGNARKKRSLPHY